MNIKTELDISPYRPETSHINKIELWKETISAWDKIVEAGYSPANIAYGVITMRYRDFKRLIDDTGGKCGVENSRNYRINCVWLNNVEICYTEIKDDRDLYVEENWKPLGEYDEFFG